MALASVSGTVAKTGIAMAMGLVLSGCGGGSGGGGESPPDVAVSGVIDIEAGTRVDADNADALLGRAPLTTPQSLPPEFILAGYVSDSAQAGDYPPLAAGSDSFQYFPDREDQYVTSLQGGLELTLQSFATRLGAVSDLRLKVTAPDGSILPEETVTGNGAPVTIQINNEQAGEYTLSVTALDGWPMLYILSSSRMETSTPTAFDWPRHEFVEDEAIVALRDTGNAAGPASALMAPGRQIAPGLWMVNRPSTVAALGQGSQAEQTLEWIRGLRDDPAIRHASPNYRTRALATPVDEPLYPSRVLGQQWHYSLINGPVAWQLAPAGGDGVNVAVLDTGLFRSGNEWHPDFQVSRVSNVIDGFDPVDGDNLPADPGNAVGGSVYHGTHVAGTVAAAVNGAGGAGVAFGSNLMPVRVLGEGGSGTLSDLLAGMQWVLGNQSRPQADIVNLSLGGLPCGDPGVAGTLQQLINQGVDKGIIYVAAAGNSATREPSCPAALENVFSVSAVDGGGRLASYSNFGSTIDLAAPGGDASRDGNGDGQGDLVSSTSAGEVDGQVQAVYRGLQGTSMAAPHVSGVLALMKQARPALNSRDIESYLINGDLTLPPCESGCNRTDQLGYGILDAGKSVQSALSTSPPELLTSSPAVANLVVESGISAPETVAVSRLGDSSIRITGASASDNWFAVSPSVDATGLTLDSTNPVAEFELTLIPENLEVGLSSRGSLTVVYDTPTEGEKRLVIPVIGQQITDQQARDAGRHFILLVDPEPRGDTFVTVGQAVATVEAGRYRFEFLPDDGQAPERQNEVPPGKYFLVAGTDLDNDGLICHAGEACAEYPVAGLRQVIEVRDNESVTGLRMTTSYSRPALSVNSPDLLPRPGFKGYRLLPEPTGSPSTTIKSIGSPGT